MRVEIICIGTELLIGQKLNTNVHYISQKCSELGVNVYFHTTVGDNFERIHSALQIASKRADLVICSGGIGPTLDDLTKDVLAHHMGNLKMYIHTETLHKIKNVFDNSGLEMPERNVRQANLIQGSTPLLNDVGLAIGLAIEYHQAAYILLPGPPRELQAMFENYAMPWIHSITNEKLEPLFSKYLKFSGVPESELERLLFEIIDKQSDPTIATYASVGELTIRLTTRAPSLEIANNTFQPLVHHIKQKTQEFLYAERNISIEQAVVDALLDRQQKVAITMINSGDALQMLINKTQNVHAVLNGVSMRDVGEYLNNFRHQKLIAQNAVLNAQQIMTLIKQSETFGPHVDYNIILMGNIDKNIQLDMLSTVFYMAIGNKKDTQLFSFHSSGDAYSSQLRAAKHALYLLYKNLKEG